MMKKLMAAGLSGVLLLLLAPSGFGHGGQYRGPGDTVPPNLGGGGDTTPPGNPGGPGTPGPGAPTTGGGRGPASGGGPVAPTVGNTGAGRATTGGAFTSRRGAAEGFERWEFWWEHNKEPFLNLKARLDNSTVQTDSVGFHVGRGTRTDVVTSNRPTAEDVKREYVPQLLPLLQEKHPDVVDSAVLSIARMLRKEDGDIALQSLVSTLGHDEKTARESATLALGVLGNQGAVEPLKQILLDTPEGRKLTGRGNEVEDIVRAFSAASLGLIGMPETIADLEQVISDERLNSKRDLKAMAILSLGLMKQGHEEVVAFLMKCMNDRSLDRIVKAQAPVALGKLYELNDGGSPAARAVLKEVVNLFLDDKTDLFMTRSLAVCLGMLGNVEDTEVIDALINAVAKSEDDQTRHFSIMALAQIGSRDTTPDSHADVHTKIENFFLEELTRPKRVTHQPYGALGLAVYTRGEALESKRAGAAAKILEAFQKTNNPSYKGAMAVSLGLLNYKDAEEALWTEFDDSNDQPLQGYIALSLGLMRATDRGDAFRAYISKKGLDFKFRLQLARALGLMGDAQAVDTLINYLQESETLSETSSSAQALGLIGDKSAVPHLMAIINNTSKNPLQRGFSCVALGIIAEKTDLPWNVVFSVNSNYRAKVPALSEILDIL